jgi:hypothetical protein
MRSRIYTIAALLLIALAVSPRNAFAQGGVTATLSGTVFDSSGAVVPGATITAKNKATASTSTAISGADGLFTIPALEPGEYKVTVAMKGFATASLEDIRLSAGVPTNIKPTLTPGGVAETVVVEAAGEILKTTQTNVSTTITQQQITSLPLPGRAAFDLVTFIPGVTTTDGTSRGAIVNGLPQSAVNITLDGMNIQDNYLKTSDGMFTRVSPRLDAVEEVTISTAAQSADMAGQGGVQIKFVTRSGTNDFHGSAYYYLRRDWMNSNTWFNLHRNVDTFGNPTATPVQKQFQPGGRLGGPVRIPKIFNGRNKLFFFVNYEWVSSPGTSTSTRTIMSPDSEKGIFNYTGGQPVDLMALAARSGQVSKIDPLIGKLLGDVRNSTSNGVVNATTDPLTQSFVWQQPTKSKTTYPTGRLDYNVTVNHRLTASLTQNHIVSDPDTTNSVQTVYPGFPVHGLQDSVRYSGQAGWRWTVSPRIVNEFHFGKTGGATQFSPDLVSDMFAGTGFGGMNGYAVSWSGFKSISNPYPSSTVSSREGKTMVFEDNLSWVKGSHLLSMGVSYTKAEVWLYNQTKAPVLTLGMATGDPADTMFVAANFPNASSTDLTNAKNLYSVLTGRVTAITRNARIQPDGKNYKILGSSDQYGTLPQWGSFINDSWRVRPTLTINAGLRYDVQRPFYAQNDSYSTATLNDVFGVTGVGPDFQPGSTINHLGNLFKPGTLQGSLTTFKQLPANTNAYSTDWGGVAPSLGAAWTIGSDSGILHAILGSKGTSVLRAGASLSYQRGGMSDFTGVYGNNPGISIDASRNQTNGNLGNVPVLLSSSDLGPPSINLTRTFPIPYTASSSVYVFDPHIKTPSAFSYNISFQRQLAKSLSVEARFIHTNSFNTWTANGQIPYMDYNELNITENGFLNEFKLAQANLQANIAAGKGQTFAYTGAAGTQPLPIFLAYLNGSSAAGDTTKYAGNNWTNSTLVQSMYPLNPNPYVAANSIWSTSNFRANAANAGKPANFFVANPDVNHAYMVTNGPLTSYNGIQVALNRRFVRGLQFDLNYTYGKGWQDQFYSFRKPYVTTEQNYSNSGSGSETGNVRHVLVSNWTYQLPFGKGKRFAGNANGLLDRIVGGWSYQGVARLQSGRMVDLGNVRLFGMTPDEVRNGFQLRQVTDPQNRYRTLVYMLPQDIIDNTIKAFSVNASGYTNGAPSGRYFAPANNGSCFETGVLPGSSTNPYPTSGGFGDCGIRSLIVTGPKVVRFDMNLIKQIKITERVVIEGQAQVFNVFNNTNFNPVNYLGSVSDSYQVTGAIDQSRTMQLAFRISF